MFTNEYLACFHTERQANVIDDSGDNGKFGR